ncbi:MAG: hypothetical protein ACYCS7_01485 [Acidimicrobiales bacterium]
MAAKDLSSGPEPIDEGGSPASVEPSERSPGPEPGSLLARWTADDAVSNAVTARSRQAHLARQAAEEADMAGVLIDLAELGSVVSVLTTSGLRHRGTIASVGCDFCEIRTTDQTRRTFIPLVALSMVLPSADSVVAPVAPLRRRARQAALLEVLSSLIEDRPRLSIRLNGAPTESVTGILASVGKDFMAVRTAGSSRHVSYLRLDSLAEVSILGSG